MIEPIYTRDIDLERYNLISKRQLGDAFSAPMNMYPVVNLEDIKVRWIGDIQQD